MSELSPEATEIALHRLIGGMFGLQPTKTIAADEPIAEFLSGRRLFLANARSAILLLIRYLRPPIVWLPSYLCPTIVAAVRRSDADIRYYPIDMRLSAGDTCWVKNVRSGHLVILIDYFGFPCDENLANRVKEQGAVVLEDASQALLSRKRLQAADYILFSPRKFVGVPDGGILVAPRNAQLPQGDLPPAPVPWWLNSLEATVKRRVFDETGVENDWFQWYIKAKEDHPVEPFRISELSANLLFSAFDYPGISKKRIENFKILYAELQSLALLPPLPEGVVPLGFPIRLDNRDQVVEALHDQRIYPPIHWQVESSIPSHFSESIALSHQIMTLPCDQRYTEDDMLRMSTIVRFRAIADRQNTEVTSK